MYNNLKEKLCVYIRTMKMEVFETVLLKVH